MNLPPNKNEELSIEERLGLIRERLAQGKRNPLSTYRVQFNKDFTFRHARSIVDYLSRLGISHCYTSPYLAAGPGSEHGYDICDYSRLNPEIGSEADFEDFVNELAGSEMGHILDFVPNHMGIASGKNKWWQDVLQNGSASRYSKFFDIDWNPVKAELNGKVLLPILGNPYGAVLEQGGLKLEFQEGVFSIRYYDHVLPVNPRSSTKVLSYNLQTLQEEIPEDDNPLREFLGIITALNNLPTGTDHPPEKLEESAREKEMARERLQRLMKEAPRIKRHVEENVRIFNGVPGRPESFDLLHELLNRQFYRLSNWRSAAQEINYRRFFDINHLAGIRVELDEVFDLTHAFILGLLAEGKICGLRLDHIDGLFNPAGYFEKLQESFLLEYVLRDKTLRDIDPQTLRDTVKQWRKNESATHPAGPARRPMYLVLEKILTGTESLPENWAAHGTNGYEFMNDVNGLFVNSENEKAVSKIYSRFTGKTAPLAEIVYECKKLIMQNALSSELNVLVRALNLISEENRHHRDFTLNSLRDVLREVVACFPIYRTYIDENGYNPDDRETVEKSIARARKLNPALEPTIFDFLKDTMLPEPDDGDIPESQRKKQYEFTMKFQQFTGPVQAKGLEDTAFYRYNRLLSLNEVGGQPQRFGLSASVFHTRNQKRQKNWPRTMITTATHDHKRGEDVRARLNIISEIPDEWAKVIRRWALLNRSKRTLIDGEYAPDRNDEYFFYQTLVGMWPPGPASRIDFKELLDRLTSYMHKAGKEAKVYSSWINPNDAYDEAVKNFVVRVLTPSKSNRFLDTFFTPSRSNRFLDTFLPFQERVAKMGVINSLAQTLLKLTSPGIPDIYQGNELWDLSLVDPDNRRPVDFSHRRKLLEKMEPLLAIPCRLNPVKRTAALVEMLDKWEDGRIKMFVTACGLRLRRDEPDLFLEGDYLPLQVEGSRADHVASFARLHRKKISITVVPRLVAGLMEPDLKWPVGDSTWGDTRIVLPSALSGLQSCTDLITQTPVPTTPRGDQMTLALGNVFTVWPLALLTGNL